MDIDISVVGSASSVLSRIRLEARRATDSISGLTSNITEHNRAVSNASNSISGMITQYVALSRVVGIAKTAISDFSDLEEKTLDIAKTTGLAGKELEDFTESLNELNRDVRGMKLDSLYEISAIAGQLGIKGKDDLLAFTESVQRIAKTSKLTAEQAGEGFAKLSNSLNEPIKNIEKLTSTFTILASTTTANEVSLLDFTQRLAGAGKTLGLTTAQIAGIGATLNDIGLSAEVAGTAMSQIFQKMLTETDLMIEVLNLDAKRFRDAIKNEPVKAVEMLISSLGRLDKQAKIDALKDLKMTGSGLSSTLLKLSMNTEKLTANIATATKGYIDGDYTIKEFDVATKGLATTQQQLSDQVKQTSASFGKLLAPSVEAVSKTFILLLKDIQAHNVGILQTVKIIGGLIIAWKAFNVAMNASPFGRMLAGLTAILGIALKIRATMLRIQNRENEITKAVIARKRLLATESGRVAIAHKLEKTQTMYVKKIEEQQRLLIENKNLSSQQKKIVEDEIALAGKRLNKLLIRKRKLLGALAKPVNIKVTTPKITVPKIEVPKIEVPKISVPKIDVPKVDIPKISVPSIEVPKIDVPRIDVPKINVPKIDVPKIEVDKIEVPKIHAPKIKLDKVEVPKVNTGNIKKYNKEREKSVRLALREKEELKRTMDSFNNEYAKSVLEPFKYQLLSLKKERDQWIKKGVSPKKANDLYNVKVAELYAKKRKEALEIAQREQKVQNTINKSFSDEFAKNTLSKLDLAVKRLNDEKDKWISKGVSPNEANDLYKLKVSRLYAQERKKAEESAKREQEIQDNINQRFKDELLKNTLPAFEMSIVNLKKERDEWVAKGVQAKKATELYNVKLKKLVKQKAEESAKEAKAKVKELKTQKKINEELKKQKDQLGTFLNSLGDIALKGADNALNNFAQTGEADFGSVISSSDLKSSGNPYAMAIGVVGDLISGAMSNSPSEFYKKETNVGADDTGIIDAINSLKNDAMINQLDATRKMLKQLEELNSKFRAIAINIAPSGAYAPKTDFDINKVQYQEFGLAISDIVEFIIGDNVVSTIIGGIFTGFFGSSNKEIEHAGIAFGEQTVASFLDGVDVEAYQDIKETKKAIFGIISSSSYSTEYQAVSDQVKSYFQESVRLQVDIIKNSAEILNQDVSKIDDKLKNINIDLGKFDFKDKTQDEIQAILQGAMSRQLGLIGNALLPFIDDFKKQGENYTTTLIRVASDYDKAKTLLRRINVDIINIKDVTNKNGDVLAETVRDSIVKVEESFDGLSGIGEIIKSMSGTGRDIVDTYKELFRQQQILRAINNENASLSGDVLNQFEGLDEYSALQSSFYDEFATNTQKILDLQDEISRVTGANIPRTKEEYAQLVKNQDLSTEEGREKYAQLLKEQDSFLALIRLQDEARIKEEERLSSVGSSIEDARTKEEDSIQKIYDTWISVLDGVRSKIQSTIDSINSKYEKGKNGLVQQLSDLSFYKDKLQESLNTGNIDDTKMYSDRLASVSQALASNGGVYKDIALRELTRVKDQLPQKEIQKVEIVNDEKSTKILNTMYTQLGTQKEDNREIIRLLGKIASELSIQTNKDEVQLIKGE